MKKSVIPVVILLLLLFSGCGGGDSVTSPQSITSSSGSLEFSAKWPGSGDDISAQVIQPEVERIEITITGSNIPTPIIIYLNKGETTKVISSIPAGTVKLEFRGLNSIGTVLSSRITEVTVLAGQTVNVSVILGISILADGFYPSTITIYRGDTLVFVNNDTVPHTIIIPGKTDSVTIQPGSSYSCLFDTDSKPSYNCTGDGGKSLTIIIENTIITTPPTPSGPVATKEIFIDLVAGSDPNGNGTFEKPYQTLDRGISVANSDMTVSSVTVIAQNDPTSYTPVTTLNIRSNVKVKKYDSDPNTADNECVIDFSGAAISSSGGIILGGNNSLQNFTVQKVAEGSGIKVAGSNCTIKECTVKNNYYSFTFPLLHNGAGIFVGGTNCIINHCSIGENSLIGEGRKVTPPISLRKPEGRKFTGKNVKDGKNHRQLKEMVASDLPELPSGGWGGGIFIDTGASCVIEGSINFIIANYAPIGGGIANKGFLKISRTIISANGALFAGGGIANTGTLNVDGVNFFDNTVYYSTSDFGPTDYSTFSGGAIANIGICNVTGRYGLELMYGNRVTSDNETDFLCGGAVSNTVYTLSGGSTLKGTCNLKDIMIIENSLYAQSGTAEDAYGAGLYNAGIMTVTGALMDTNKTQGYGGAMCNDFWITDSNIVASVGNCTINNSTIGSSEPGYKNYARYCGGGIVNYATCTINGSTIKSNYAYDCGAGIFEYTYEYDIFGVKAICTINNSIIGGPATEDGNDAYAGGGIYIADPYSLLNITGTINIDNNFSESDGGGIANEGKINLSATGTIDNNRVTVIGGKGGGLYNYDGSTCSLKGSGTITGNSATTPAPAGGGIFNEPSSNYSNTGWTVTGNTPDQVVGP